MCIFAHVCMYMCVCESTKCPVSEQGSPAYAAWPVFFVPCLPHLPYLAYPPCLSPLPALSVLVSPLHPVTIQAWFPRLLSRALVARLQPYVPFAPMIMSSVQEQKERAPKLIKYVGVAVCPHPLNLSGRHCFCTAKSSSRKAALGAGRGLLARKTLGEQLSCLFSWSNGAQS